MPRRPQGLIDAPPARGVVRAPAADGVLEGRRVLPPPSLAEHVHHFGFLRWSLRSPYSAEALSYPVAQWLRVDERGRKRAELVGVHAARMSRRLEGEGSTFSITFRAAMFQPLLGASMTTITDRVLPLAEVLGARAGAWARAVDAARTLEAKVDATEAFLAPLLPPLDARVVQLRDLAERIAKEREILRVEDVERISGLDKRTLQRAFRTYVGLPPKWVIQRHRLQEAAARLAANHPPALAELAASLGYADQAHFARDFKRAVGVTPSAFTLRR